MAKINDLLPGQAYEATLCVKTGNGLTNPTRISFTTPKVLNPVIKLAVEDIKEQTAKIAWERNGTATERYAVITRGPYGEQKTTVLAGDSNKDLVKFRPITDLVSIKYHSGNSQDAKRGPKVTSVVHFPLTYLIYRTIP